MYVSNSNIVIATATSSRTDYNGFSSDTTRKSTRRTAQNEHASKAHASYARQVSAGLTHFISDGSPVPAAAHIQAAARVFSEGTCYYSGQMIDRSI